MGRPPAGGLTTTPMAIESAPALPSTERLHSRNNIDAIRLILATLVILSHAFELVDGDRHRELLTRAFGGYSFGELAVNAFFILSGYLIAQSAVRTASPLRFLRKRVLRIYPGFLVAAVVSCFVAGYIGSGTKSAFFATFPWASFAKRLVTLNVPDIPGVFAGQPYPSVNGSAWTLRFEFICYLTVLLTAYVLRPRSGRVALAIMLGSLLASAASLVAHVPWHVGFMNGPDLLHFLTLFYAGAALSYYPGLINPRRWALYVGAYILALFLCRAISDAGWHYVIDDAATATIGAVALLSAGFTPHVRTVLGTSDYSYGVYLYGWPAAKVMLWYVPTAGPWMVFWGSFAAALAMAWGSWHFVEKPALGRK
jgi:peptidoglycan/LPS O-acetylase OafA/YrhL